MNISKHLDILCPHGCFKHKRLVLVDVDNKLYEGLCLDCHVRLNYTFDLLKDDITDNQTIFLESQSHRRLVDELKQLGFEDIANNVSEKLIKCRLLNGK